MKDRNPEISVIMPVYNSALYLTEAIQNILEQSFTDFEFILIDDGSTDGSEKICDEYKEKDNRIIVIHQENCGMCASRNRALHLARGKYIAFMDNDDKCEPDLLKCSYDAAEKYNADLVKFGRTAITVDKNGTIYEVNNRNLNFDKYNREEIKKNFISLRKQGVLSPVWDGLYRKELIIKKQIFFDETLRYGEEDTIFCMKIVSEANKIVLIPGIYYIHFIRLSHSASTKIADKALEKYFVSLNAMVETLENLNINFKNDINFFDCFLQVYVLEFLLKLNYGDNILKEKKRWIKDFHDQIHFTYNFSFFLNVWKVCGKRSVLGILWLVKADSMMYYLVKIWFRKKIAFMKNN